MKEQIKIILIGDTGTGKSSVISSYISKYFPHEVPSVLVDAIIPPDSTANNVSVTIMDSSTIPGDRDVLHQKIRMADSVIALYDVTRPETIDSLEELWLPTISDIWGSFSVSKAVIVVGNKTDLVNDQDENQMDTDKVRMKKILKDFPFVVACYRCSAKLVDVDQIFYASELAVTFPVGPLFDTTRSEFTAPCKTAFLRVFRCFDSDQDGLLNNDELNSLQQQSFGVPLKDEEVSALKQEISKSVRGGLQDDMITFSGLMGIMRLCIYRGQQQVPWTILARYGCEEHSFSLEVPSEIEEIPELSLGESFELSSNAFEFLFSLALNASSRRFLGEDNDSALGIKNIRTSKIDDVLHNSSNDARKGGNMTWRDLEDIVAVMPTVTHPWCYPPICQDEYDDSEHIFLLAGSSAPSRISSNLAASLSESGMFTSWIRPATATSLGTICKNEKSEKIIEEKRFGGDNEVKGKVGRIDFMWGKDEVGGSDLGVGVGLGVSCDVAASSVSSSSASTVTSDKAFCSIHDWMAQWQMFAVHRPLLTQSLLFRLGYVERADIGLKIVGDISPLHLAEKKVVNVCLLGGAGVGKADLVRALSSLTAQPQSQPQSQLQSRSSHHTPSAAATSECENIENQILEENATFPFNDSDVMEIESEGYPLYVLRAGYDCDVEYCSDSDGGVGKKGGEGESGEDNENANDKKNGNKKEKKEKASLYVHGSCSVQTKTGRVSVVFTAVPYDRALHWIASDAASCDLAVMVLHCSDLQGDVADTHIDYLTNTDTETETGNHQNTATLIPCYDFKGDIMDLGSDRFQDLERGGDSLTSALRLEQALPQTLPRVYIANRSDLLSIDKHHPTQGRVGMHGSIPEEFGQIGALVCALEHLKKYQLPPLIFVSTVSGEGIEELKKDAVNIASHPTLGIPSITPKKQKSSQLIWVAGKVMCAVVTVALIATAIVLRRESTCKEEGANSNSATNVGTRCTSWIRRALMRILSATGQGK